MTVNYLLNQDEENKIYRQRFKTKWFCEHKQMCESLWFVFFVLLERLPCLACRLRISVYVCSATITCQSHMAAYVRVCACTCQSGFAPVVPHTGCKWIWMAMRSTERRLPEATRTGLLLILEKLTHGNNQNCPQTSQLGQKRTPTHS